MNSRGNVRINLGEDPATAAAVIKANGIRHYDLDTDLYEDAVALEMFFSAANKLAVA